MGDLNANHKGSIPTPSISCPTTINIPLELDKVQDVSVTGIARPMAVSPDRRFLFVALRSDPCSIASFAIDGANGMLPRRGNAHYPK